MQEAKLNSRVKFPENKQKQFLDKTASKLNTDVSGLAKISQVCDRTVRDWRREKYNIDFYSLFLICYKIRTSFPKNIKVLSPYWSTKKASRLGGIRHVQLYGPPGTLESRIKGGINSQKKFRENPEYAEKVKFFLRKQIKYPPQSKNLAEFIVIMLGDGCVCSSYQISAAFNGQMDIEYARHIQRLVKNLFNISSKVQTRKKDWGAKIVVSATNLVNFLEKIGIKKGNKVKNQVEIPDWIFKKKEYQTGCLRGLFDTDGCVYKHSYKVGGKLYSYLKMSFRNYSIPLLKSIKQILENLDLHPVIDIKHQTVYINRATEVKRYFLDIGTSNPRYLERFQRFSK